jgi:hypothetical protein
MTAIQKDPEILFGIPPNTPVNPNIESSSSWLVVGERVKRWCK